MPVVAEFKHLYNWLQFLPLFTIPKLTAFYIQLVMTAIL
jgi:hypothetical protein